MADNVVEQRPEQKLEPNPNLGQNTIEGGQPDRGVQEMKPIQGIEKKIDKVAKDGDNPKEPTEEEKKQQEIERKEAEKREKERQKILDERKKKAEAEKQKQEKKEAAEKKKEDKADKKIEKYQNALNAVATNLAGGIAEAHGSAAAAQGRINAANEKINARMKDFEAAIKESKAKQAEKAEKEEKWQDAENKWQEAEKTAKTARDTAGKKKQEADAAEEAAATANDEEREQKQIEAEQKRQEANAAEAEAEAAEAAEEKARTEADNARTEADNARTEAEKAEADKTQKETEVEAAFRDANEARKDKDAAEAILATEQKKMRKAEKKAAKKIEKAEEKRVGAEEKKNKAAARKEAIGKVMEDVEDEAKEDNEEEVTSQDEFNNALLNAAVLAGTDDIQQENAEDENRKFDTLADLGELAKEANRIAEFEAEGTEETKGADTGKGEKNVEKGLRQKVLEIRKGNLYKAVIIKRDPHAARKQGNGSGHLSRFLDSSIVNKGIDIGAKSLKSNNAVFGSGGIIGQLDPDYAKSTGATAVTAVTDALTLITTLPGVMKKLRDFKKNNTTVKKVFAGISIASDVLLMISKIASLLKLLGEKTSFKKIIPPRISRMISTAATMLSQAAGITVTIKSIVDLFGKREELKKDHEKEKVTVKKIVTQIESGKEAPDNEEEDSLEEGESLLEKDEKQDGQNDSKKAQKNDSKNGQKKDKKGVQKAQEQGNEEDEDDKEEEKLKERVRSAYALAKSDKWKEILGSYLGRERTLAKKKFDIVNSFVGLTTSVLGLGSSIAKSASNHYADIEEDAKDGVGPGLTEEQKQRQGKAKKFSQGFGIASDAAILASNAVMPIAGEITNAAVSEDKRRIKEGLMAAVNDLSKDEDKYGLRGIENALLVENPDKDVLTKADTAVKRYKAVEKRFDGSGVNFNRLFEETTKGKKDFEESLEAAL